LFLLLAGVVAYLVLAAVFLGAAWRTNARAKWLGLAVLAAAAPGFFWFGIFAEQFTSGQCYTEVMHHIANAVERTDSPKTLAQRIRASPMYGYETVCSKVEAAGRELPDAVAP
jgi:hypothetical protein